MPRAARRITPDRAVHLALTYNQWMYRSTAQKRAQLEDAIYHGYVSAIKDTLEQCLMKETQEFFRFCRPLYKAYFDAIAPMNNLQFLWVRTFLHACDTPIRTFYMARPDVVSTGLWSLLFALARARVFCAPPFRLSPSN